ncbi:hypothetical protein [Mycobacterium branderi]|uniref:Antitoxin Xre/MbcA/ParS-like toxin-binding domain-containing protein n=1 Tax=Mycobacterium branderi TaxID=43348 RepID=A0A7I7VZ51_9MYCO|nr:hypothetical protein [Mycobacterium branderi]MCV7233459.1 hypothetical protein [Mycobacterium branderi]ORA41507.1 hypothetical protein BST20_05305 [Mycobacterium branderi]BBZ10576.1 hypothetical protein MBRA_07710 [Mycobacterium branderi]
MSTGEDLAVATQRIRQSAQAVQAEHNLYRRIDAEFGMLTGAAVGKRMGSRSRAPRNLAASAHRNNHLIAIRQGNHLVYPGFQFGPDGRPLAVIGRLREIAEANDWSEVGLVQWLCSPTTYFDGDRPVDHLVEDPDGVVAVAADDMAIEW